MPDNNSPSHRVSNVTPSTSRYLQYQLDRLRHQTHANKRAEPLATSRRHPEDWVREGQGYWVLDLNIPENMERYSRSWNYTSIVHDGSAAHDELHLQNVKSSGAVWYADTHPYIAPRQAMMTAGRPTKENEKAQAKL